MILLKNAAIVDGAADKPVTGMNVLIEGDRFREVSDKPIKSSAQVIDLKGKTLMPGLIDCHVHVIASLVNLAQNALLPNSLIAARASGIMHAMLMRGFTTVRDVGGADVGLKLASEEGSIIGPRLVMSGKALSQTGGHADLRGPYDARERDYYIRQLGSLGRICDGVPEARRAAREELKGGADFIKIMANGGVASPTDPIQYFGFSREEVTAIVEEAEMARTYVAAHLYTDDAIRRCVECGVKSVEHANLITPATAKLMVERGAWAVPTLVTFEALKQEGESLGLPPVSIGKIDDVRLSGLKSLDIMRSAGVTMAYGTDLLGDMHRRQSEEFTIRAQVLPVQEVIASATSVAADVVGMKGRLGVIAPDAFADLIVVDGDPLKGIAVLTGQGDRMAAIMKGGEFVKNTLN
ncbi:MAG: amidohydrolase family protein [Rhizobiales bacterium]|nr:amidohydrolase family protein [Hyphomicrobiales bacterium]